MHTKDILGWSKVKVIIDSKGEHYFSYASLFYAKAISSIQIKGKEYTKGFEDLNYESLDSIRYKFIENHMGTHSENKIKVALKNLSTNNIETVTLIPFGKTILRQVSF